MELNRTYIVDGELKRLISYKARKRFYDWIFEYNANSAKELLRRSGVCIVSSGRI